MKISPFRCLLQQPKPRGFAWMRLLLVPAFVMSGCDKPAAPGGPPKMPPQDVGVVTVVPRTVELVTELPGRTTAYRVAEVRPQVSGVILERLFTEGSEVKEGEQLYQIDPATYQAAFDSASAAVAKAEAAADIARLMVERRKKLAANDVISKEAYDDVVAALKQADAGVAAAKASLETARVDLEYTKVMSPISGRIGRSSVTEGALVTARQATALATVQQLDPIYVDITQSSTELLRLQREVAAGHIKTVDGGHATATLSFEDGSPYPHEGKIQFAEVSVDEDTASVTLRAVFPNPEAQLLPGMFVRAKVSEGVRENAILVPQKGVTRNPRGEPTALLVGPSNTVEQRVLKIDRSYGDQWLVTSGIIPGDRVILEGLQKTAPGREVNPVEIAPKN